MPLKCFSSIPRVRLACWLVLVRSGLEMAHEAHSASFHLESQNNLPNLCSSPCWGVLIQRRPHPRVYPWATHWEHPWPRVIIIAQNTRYTPVTPGFPVFCRWDALAIFMVSVRSSRASKGFRKAASLKETTSWNQNSKQENPKMKNWKKGVKIDNNYIECILMHVAYFCLTKCCAILDSPAFFYSLHKTSKLGVRC